MKIKMMNKIFNYLFCFFIGVVVITIAAVAFGLTSLAIWLIKTDKWMIGLIFIVLTVIPGVGYLFWNQE